MPHYDFNWRLGHDTDIKAPEGSKKTVDAHCDNSSNNESNPDPHRALYYGDQTWEEMMAPFFGIVVDVKQDPGGDNGKSRRFLQWASGGCVASTVFERLRHHVRVLEGPSIGHSVAYVAQTTQSGNALTPYRNVPPTGGGAERSNLPSTGRLCANPTN